jgi:hypothetical protein
MQLRHTIITGVFASAVVLGTTVGALAQSHQGGYLGLNPAANIASTAPAPSVPPSHQGGYLGNNPGAHLPSARSMSPTLSEELSDPIAWCSKSTDPDHCRANASVNHPICVKDPEHYDSCRYALSQMFKP